jgi:hypothetical protein
MPVQRLLSVFGWPTWHGKENRRQPKIVLDMEIRFGMGRSREPKFNSNRKTNMTARKGNAPRGSATSNVAERSPHRGRSLNTARLPFEIRECTARSAYISRRGALTA